MVKSTFLMGVIGLALGGLVGYDRVYVPSQQRVHQIHTQIAQEEEQQQTKTEVAALLLQIDQYRKRLPDEPDPSWLIREVVAHAKQAGVQLTTINQAPPQTFPEFTHLSVNLQFTASYHQLGTFLDAIERSNRLIRVEQLHLRAVDEGNADAQATIQLVLGTLYLPPLLRD